MTGGHSLTVMSHFELMRIAGLSLILVMLMANFACAEETSETSQTAMSGDLIIVIGAPGAEEFASQFSTWADRWEQAGRQGSLSVTRIDPEGGGDDDLSRTALSNSVTGLAQGAAAGPLWIVLIGHGSFDGRTAKFNLAGQDVSSSELSEWLALIQRPTAIICNASASGPFLNDLSAKNRVIITATKSGAEVNFARFGDYLSQAILDPTTDLDKDSQVSLLEAFLKASRRTKDFYEADGRLVTEHALIDDNADATGTRGEGFSGIQPVRDAESGETLDGHFAHQWHLLPSEAERNFPTELKPHRDDLELQLARLRDQREEFTEAEYLTKLEPLLVALARLYEQANAGDGGGV